MVVWTRLTGGQAKLWPDWCHFGFFRFLADLAGTAVEIDAFHRRHAGGRAGPPGT